MLNELLSEIISALVGWFVDMLFVGIGGLLEDLFSSGNGIV